MLLTSELHKTFLRNYDFEVILSAIIEYNNYSSQPTQPSNRTNSS